MKLKWLTSLIVLTALTGSVWAGVCGCLAEQEKGHSCCKKVGGGLDSMSAKSCCSADCETVIAAAGKNPQKRTETPSHKAPGAAAFSPEPFKIEWFSRAGFGRAPQPRPRTGDSRLRFARGPDLYLRHNSFLI